MTTALPSACGGCAQHRTDSLLRLGLNPDKWDILVALAGNPNVGKSTVFNALTGLRQHTGNWPGKTIARAEGGFAHEGKRVKLVDLPGTYSLQAGSTDEEVARDFVLFGRPDVTVVVVDATRLERNLNLALQILDITDRVVVYLNLVMKPGGTASRWMRRAWRRSSACRSSAASPGPGWASTSCSPPPTASRPARRARGRTGSSSFRPASRRRWPG